MYLACAFAADGLIMGFSSTSAFEILYSVAQTALFLGTIYSSLQVYHQLKITSGRCSSSIHQTTLLEPKTQNEFDVSFELDEFHNHFHFS
jgi:hypothetical protein